MKIGCIVDGFNLYHSICEAVEQGAPSEIKWLNIPQLILQRAGMLNLASPELAQVLYCTSLATHRRNFAHKRHLRYIKALESSGVVPIFGQFKEKQVTCRVCNRDYQAYVEKETDVNVALCLVKLMAEPSVDACLLVSGDSDLKPAVDYVRDLHPTKPLGILFPFGRWHAELSQKVRFRYQFTIEEYKTCVFPNPIVLSDGKKIHMPDEWK